MSEYQAAHAILLRQRNMLNVERDMYAGYVNRSEKHTEEHWRYLKQQQLVEKELRRISHRLKLAH
jgi:hypothetical protein